MLIIAVLCAIPCCIITKSDSRIIMKSDNAHINIPTLISHRPDKNKRLSNSRNILGKQNGRPFALVSSHIGDVPNIWWHNTREILLAHIQTPFKTMPMFYCPNCDCECVIMVIFSLYHDDVIKWKHFPRYWSFVRGIHRSPVNSPRKGQWRRSLMFSLICARINGWVNNGEAGDLRCHCAHYDVSVMVFHCWTSR